MATPRLITFDITLAANGRVPLALTGDFLFVLEATGPFNLHLGQEYRAKMEKGLKYRTPPGQRFSIFDVEDLSGAPNVIRFAYGEGDFDDSRLTIVGGAIALDAPTIAAIEAALRVPLTRAVSIDDANDVTLNNGAQTLLLSADAPRRRAIVVSDPANTVKNRIGKNGTGGAARGALLQPGPSITLNTSAAIYAYAGAAAQKVSIIMEYD